jgi:hypothetical protein
LVFLITRHFGEFLVMVMAIIIRMMRMVRMMRVIGIINER